LNFKHPATPSTFFAGTTFGELLFYLLYENLFDKKYGRNSTKVVRVDRACLSRFYYYIKQNAHILGWHEKCLFFKIEK
jgi:hypothetical protein